MVFQPFDAEKDPLAQGFIQGAYDLIVAFYVIHATSNLERCLGNLRKLLKPGGFLVVGEAQEVQHDLARSGFIFGTLPGWWLGADSGRNLSPQVSLQEWDRLLRSTGFSGVDATPPEDFRETFGVCHFVSQAIDDQVNFLREPLVSAYRPPPLDKVVVIGGQSPRSSHLSQGLEDIFRAGFATQVHAFKTLVDVDFSVVDANSAVVSLVELDRPIFEDMTAETFEALKTMYALPKTLLWVTSGRLGDEPFANMTVGFGRTARHETPDLHIQQLDIADPHHTSPQTIAELLLRLKATVSSSNYTGNAEPEIVIDEKQRQFVSRLRPIRELNDRYNSARRSIKHEVEAAKSCIELRPTPKGYVMQALPRYESSAPKGFVSLEVTHTTISALPTPFGPKFLALGVDATAGVSYMALIPSLASVVNVSSKSLVCCQTSGPLDGVELLATTGAHLISKAALDPLSRGQTLLAHNVTSPVARALAMQAAVKGVSVVFSTDASEHQAPDSWHKLAPYLSQVELNEFLLFRPSAFLGMSKDEAQRSANETGLASSLPPYCHIMKTKTVFSSIGCESSPCSDVSLKDMLCVALNYAQEHLLGKNPRPSKASILHLDNFSEGAHPEDPLFIVDWTAATSLSVPVCRLDVKPMFKGADSTYWVVGMTGGMGISLCDWMISKGARNIVLTSRNPDVAPEWMESHRKRKANVVVIAWLDPAPLPTGQVAS